MKAVALALAIVLAPAAFPDSARARERAQTEGWTVEGFDGSTTSRSATLIWRTRVPTVGILSVGLSPTDFSYREVQVAEPGTSHLVMVDNLPPGTRFYFTVLATDQDGVNVASEIISKKTKGP